MQCFSLNIIVYHEFFVASYKLKYFYMVLKYVIIYQVYMNMKAGTLSFLSLILAPLAAFAVNEGVPSYYQTYAAPNANQIGYDQYANQGYTKYIGKSGSKQVVGSRSYSYQVPHPMPLPTYSGTMTPNGVSMPPESEPSTTMYASYARRFADFEFETGFQNSYTVRARDRNFNFIRFLLKSEGDRPCAVHRISAIYKINKYNKGVV